jgi:beta-1,4-mannosyltransferase
MWEKSPFTLTDFVKQRKRWLQGILLVVHDHQLPFRVRIGLGNRFNFFIRVDV